MRFEPKPRNDFEEFFETYYEECRRRFPRIAAVAGKWRFEDLIPGLSDFDTRLVVEDGMTVEDWCNMSTAVGEAHVDLCRRFPRWARNLEHLPGISLTWSELMDPELYCPEYPQWTFHRTADLERLGAAEEYLARRPWCAEDEHFHLKKFCQCYGRYDRALDPPINLGPFSTKHPLHSRFMHYFCPPLQAALCILERRPIRGKMEAIRIARRVFPEEDLFREMQEVVECHYEAPELYEAPQLADLEDRLEQALTMLRDRLAPNLSLVPAAEEKTVSEWQAALAGAPVSPLARVFFAISYARLMKGRLRFYASAPEHFDSVWLIENELGRLRASFFDIPFAAYWEARTGERLDDPACIVQELCPEILSEDEVRCVDEFVRLLPGHWEDGEQQAIAQALTDIFDGFVSALCKIAAALRDSSRGTAECA